MYEVVVLEKARKALQKIRKSDSKAYVKLLKGVKVLEDYQNAPNIKKLSGLDDCYRIRVGQYRVLFETQERIKIIEVYKVAKRDERTYK